ncbi:MAG: T9SS type A sorting domain-containing protein [Ignavibacteria bacterium]|nr:T9SS type A sorting domain-containing protein [Ignavibacteria bacterium]
MKKSGYFFPKQLGILAIVSLIAATSIASLNGITGRTPKSGTSGCSCHGNLSSAVGVVIAGPDTLQPGATGQYTVTITGGPLVKGGVDIAVSTGTLVAGTGLKLSGGELTHSTPMAASSGKVVFSFSYKAPATTGTATMYSTGNSVNNNQSESGDQWNFSANKTITVKTAAAVELTAFAGQIVNKSSLLSWSTTSENNNKGFYIERSIDQKPWERIYFVNGKSDCGCISNYTYTDVLPQAIKVNYRLIQEDFSGNQKIYYLAESLYPGGSARFDLLQNYPNPFNPSTQITYSLPEEQHVSVKVYNAAGIEVAQLVNATQRAGVYTQIFKASNLPSGIYYYSIKTDKFTQTKKMLLIK